MPEFYSSEQTSRSRSVLAEVVSAFPEAVLIGGWGTWVRVNGVMSHDIDLILSRGDLDRLGSFAEDVSESRHLAGRKWRAIRNGIHLDLYVPYESRLGQRLGLRAERLLRYREQVGQWQVLSVDAHIATKLAALLDRPDSRPGEKDRFELQELLRQGGNGVPGVLSHASACSAADLAVLAGESAGYLLEIPGLSRSDRNAFRLIRKQWEETLAGGE